MTPGSWQSKALLNNAGFWLLCLVIVLLSVWGCTQILLQFSQGKEIEIASVLFHKQLKTKYFFYHVLVDMARSNTLITYTPICMPIKRDEL